MSAQSIQNNVEEDLIIITDGEEGSKECYLEMLAKLSAASLISPIKNNSIGVGRVQAG